MLNGRLPEPAAGGEDAEFEVPKHTIIFPQPPMRLPHELRCHAEREELARDGEGHVRWTLPLFVRVEVLPPTPSTECFLIATSDKRGWHGGDGLTVTGCGDRADFTFRCGVFERFPPVERHSRATLRPQHWNEMALALSEHRAAYWINGECVASCDLGGGSLPCATPCIGVYGFTTEYRARRFDASRDPALLSVLCDKVVTLQPSVGSGGLSLSCLSAGGEELASYQVGPEEAQAQGAVDLLRRRVAEDLGVPLCSLKLLLPDGQLLGPAPPGDRRPLMEALSCSCSPGLPPRSPGAGDRGP